MKRRPFTRRCRSTLVATVPKFVSVKSPLPARPTGFDYNWSRAISALVPTNQPPATNSWQHRKAEPPTRYLIRRPLSTTTRRFSIIISLYISRVFWRNLLFFFNTARFTRLRPSPFSLTSAPLHDSRTGVRIAKLVRLLLRYEANSSIYRP